MISKLKSEHLSQAPPFSKDVFTSMYNVTSYSLVTMYFNYLRDSPFLKCQLKLSFK